MCFEIWISHLSVQKGKVPLLLAVEAGNQSMVRELLGVMTAEQLKASAPNGDTALHLAARRKDVDMTKILVDYGANVDVQNGDGQTPLHISAGEGDEALVKYFYGVRASASIPDFQGWYKFYLISRSTDYWLSQQQCSATQRYSTCFVFKLNFWFPAMIAILDVTLRWNLNKKNCTCNFPSIF